MLNQMTHVLLDAARLGDHINEAIKLNAAHDSLYRGGPEQKLTSVAPYIFRFTQNSPFGEWFMEHGWGNSWGVLFQSSYEMPDLYKHFRKFLKVDTEDGRQMYFRFYDPRVMRIFLPNSDAAQLREFFGPVGSFISEDEDSARLIKFTQANGVLKTQQIQLSDVYQAPVKVVEAEEENVPAEVIAQLHTNKPEPPTSVETPSQKPPSPKSTKWNMFD